MADRGQANGPNLELPKLRLRRDKSKPEPEPKKANREPKNKPEPKKAKVKAKNKAVQPIGSPPEREYAPPPEKARTLTKPEGKVSTKTPPRPPSKAAEEPAPECKPRRQIRLPQLRGYIAASVAGAIIGFVVIALEQLLARATDAMNYSNSAANLIALLVILIVAIIAGGKLLQVWKAPDPLATSFLGVALMTALTLLLFIASLHSPWMLLVIPAVTAATFVLSWWVSTRWAEAPSDSR